MSSEYYVPLKQAVCIFLKKGCFCPHVPLFGLAKLGGSAESYSRSCFSGWYSLLFTNFESVWTGLENMGPSEITQGVFSEPEHLRGKSSWSEAPCLEFRKHKGSNRKVNPWMIHYSWCVWVYPILQVVWTTVTPFCNATFKTQRHQSHKRLDTVSLAFRLQSIIRSDPHSLSEGKSFKRYLN